MPKIQVSDHVFCSDRLDVNRLFLDLERRKVRSVVAMRVESAIGTFTRENRDVGRHRNIRTRTAIPRLGGGGGV